MIFLLVGAILVEEKAFVVNSPQCCNKKLNCWEIVWVEVWEFMCFGGRSGSRGNSYSYFGVGLSNVFL